jgi:3-hydroxymyristoyl/3-hydroxydecanoyl-(acyl carrier protein) dehydratase
MNPHPPFELEDLLPILPHRPPFLFVDRVTELEPGKRIAAERRLRPEEPQFAGHFPGRAMMPGVLVTEALAQTSGLLLGLSEMTAGAAPPERRRRFVLAANNMKYKHPAMPGDTLELRAQADGNFAGLFRFNVEASAGRNVIACGSLTLAQVEDKP